MIRRLQPKTPIRRVFTNFKRSIATPPPTSSRISAGAATFCQTTPQFESGPLSQDQFASYWNDGFVIVENIIPQHLIEAVLSDIEKHLDDFATTLFNKGLITNLHSDANVFSRLQLIEKQFKGATVALINKSGVVSQGIRDLWCCDSLLDAVQQILGPSIAAHPVWNLRCKVPAHEETTVPWHQDAAYAHEESWNTHQLTAWIPLLDATKETGCMEVIRGAHRSGNIATHTCCAGNTWYVDLHEDVIRKECFENPVENLEEHTSLCEVSKGSVLFLGNITPHRSLPNLSDVTRWSLDLRWQDPKLPVGFYDLKPVLPLRLEEDPEYQPDWSSWGGQDRANLQMQELDVNPVIYGPWIGRWELVNENKHTRAYFESLGTQTA